MSKLKWFMKQYWRIGQTRALLSLAMGMLSLGRVYVGGVPVLSDWGFWGAATLGIILIFAFLGIGWLYDVKGRLWSQKEQSFAERNVYKYLPNIKTYTIDYPPFYSLLITLKGIFNSMGLSTNQVEELAVYMSKYYGRAPERKDILQADSDATEYMERHPFISNPVKPKKVSLGSKAKLTFTTNVLRLSWIQDLTGFIQDAFVFAAVYVIFIFPDVATNGVVPLFYLGIGFIILSIPLLFFQTSLGWIYDKRLRAWSASNIVTVERNPYTYVAFPRQYSMDFPFYFAYFQALKEIYIAMDMDTSRIEAILDYLGKYGSYRASSESDFRKAQKLRREFGELFVRNRDMEDSI